MVKRMYKIFLIKIAVDNNLFQHLRIDTLKAFRTIPPQDNCTPNNCPPDNPHLGHLPSGQLPLGQFPIRIIAQPEQLSPRQFPPRTIAPWAIPPDNSHLQYNHFHNILRLFDVLLFDYFPFTISEIIGDYYL